MKIQIQCPTCGEVLISSDITEITLPLNGSYGLEVECLKCEYITKIEVIVYEPSGDDNGDM